MLIGILGNSVRDELLYDSVATKLLNDSLAISRLVNNNAPFPLISRKMSVQRIRNNPNTRFGRREQ